VRQAAIVADPPQLRRLAAAVAHEQPQLAAALNAWTDAYDYGDDPGCPGRLRLNG
jgi:hypothetical protein